MDLVLQMMGFALKMMNFGFCAECLLGEPHVAQDFADP